MSMEKFDQHFMSSLKNKLKGSIKYDEDSIVSSESDLEKERDTFILKESYYNLLCAILDPTAHVRKNHSFQKKNFAKPTNCEECHSIIWGKQGSQCSKCNICLHEKCLQVYQLDCLHVRSNTEPKNTKDLEAELNIRYHEIEEAYPNYFLKLNNLFKDITTDSKKDAKLVQQDYIQNKIKMTKVKLKIFIKQAMNLIAKDSNGSSDPYVTIQCGSSKIKRTKTQKKNLNPIWNESIEFEYYTTSDGILDESGNSGEKIIIRVWDEDSGLKAQLDKMLTNESDDFLGEVILDSNDLNLNVEQAYMLKGRTDSESVTGYLVFSIKLRLYEATSRTFSKGQLLLDKVKDLATSKELKCSFLQQYRLLHRHIFKNMQTIFNEISEKNDYTWLTEYCISANFKETSFKLNYFNDNLLDLILQQFSKKYAINESQKQMIHLECFYDHFIDLFVGEFSSIIKTKENNDYASNAKIFEYMSFLFNSIDNACSPIKVTIDNQTKNLNCFLTNATTILPNLSLKSSLEYNFSENRDFWYKTCMLPNKLTLLLSNYRTFHWILMRNKREEHSNEHFEKCEELKEIIRLFKFSSDFIHKHFELKKHIYNQDDLNNLLDISKLKETFENLKQEMIFSLTFDSQSQYEVLKKCIEMSITNHLNILFEEEQEGDSQISSCQSNSSSIVRQENGLIFIDKIDSFAVNKLLNILSGYLSLEIKINISLYGDLLIDHYSNVESRDDFEIMCKKLVTKHFLLETIKIVKNDQCSILKLKSEDVKLYLNLFLNLKQFLTDISLNELTLDDLLSYTFLNNNSERTKCRYSTLNEFFQPFLIEYIRIQEDQFIKYIHKIYDADKLTILAAEMANLLNRRMSTTQSIQSIKNSGSDSEIKRLKTSNGLINIENYCSPSVTDLFTILHELLQIMLKFNSSDSKENFMHESSFVNLVKSKLIAYSAHVKKEFHKVYRRNSRSNFEYSKEMNKNFENAFTISPIPALRKKSLFKSRPTTELTISSCILMNNYKRIIELLDEIELKLTNESVSEQLESIRDILDQDLNILIEEYTENFQIPLQLICQFIQSQLVNLNKVNNLMINLIDNSLYDILNDKLIICKTILANSIFKNLLEQIFKLSIKCIEDSIILKRDAKLNSDCLNHNEDIQTSFFKNKIQIVAKFFKSNDNRKNDNSLINHFQFTTIESILHHIVEFFSADEDCLTENYLVQSTDYQCVLKTLDLYLFSSNQLISNFISSQKMKQNNLTFGNILGKIRLETEIKQNSKEKNEFDIQIRLIEGRDIVVSLIDEIEYEVEEDFARFSNNMFPDDFAPFIEIYAFGPFKNKNQWHKKVIKYERIDHTENIIYFKDSIFEFKIQLDEKEASLKEINNKNGEFLSNYEVQICLKDSSCLNQFKIIGIAVLNMNELFKSAHVWKNFNNEHRIRYNFQNDQKSPNLYGKLDIWLGLKSKLSINEDGNKILKVLDRYVMDRSALEFIQLKLLSRNFQK